MLYCLNDWSDQYAIYILLIYRDRLECEKSENRNIGSEQSVFKRRSITYASGKQGET